jgi:hypothetical protein
VTPAELLARAEQLQKLAEGATKGPWEVRDRTGIVAYPPEWAGSQVIGSVIPAANARFIAAARTAVPELASLVQRLVAVAAQQDDLLRRLSECEIQLPRQRTGTAAYWQSEIAKARSAFAALDVGAIESEER